MIGKTDLFATLPPEWPDNLLPAIQHRVAESGRAFAVVSRSDSTLRGHFPGEVEALANALETDFDAWLILEGGRYPINDGHYVAEGQALIPAGETRDAAFGSVPLVLHGTSGLPDAMITRAVDLGVCKFNVNTELRIAYLEAAKTSLNASTADLLDGMTSAISG